MPTLSRHHSIYNRLTIDNIQIEQTNKTKLLGIIINQNLTWTDHLSLFKNKISKNIGIIRKNLPLIMP